MFKSVIENNKIKINLVSIKYSLNSNLTVIKNILFFYIIL